MCGHCCRFVIICGVFTSPRDLLFVAVSEVWVAPPILLSCWANWRRNSSFLISRSWFSLRSWRRVISWKSGCLLSRSDTGLRLGLHYGFFPAFNFLSFVFTFVIPLLTMLFFMYFRCPNGGTFYGLQLLLFLDLLRWSVIGLQLVRPGSFSVSSDLSLLGSIRSGWGCLWSRSDNGLRLGTPSHLITLSFP